MFKSLFCTHYYEDIASPKYFERFIASINPQGFGGVKLVICNKCGKMKIKKFDFVDIKYIEGK